MSDHDATTAHHADAHDGGPDAHDGGPDDHGHGADTLGPIDWAMWGVGVLGVVAALMVVAGFAMATNFSFIA